MSEIKDIIDSNEAANAYYRYMRKARRTNDKMPTRVHTNPQAKMLVRELNNELDKLQFGYQRNDVEEYDNTCCRCGEILGSKKHLIRSVYPTNGKRVDYYICGECAA